MKILITGASGFVGKNLIENIISNENKIIATTLDKKKILTFLNSKNLKNIKVKQLDVLDFKKCASIIKDIDLVVHLAAITDVPLSLEKPKEVIDINYIGTLNILESMRKNRVNKIIFPSTQDVYGNNTNSKEDDISKIAPLNTYSLSKLLCEHTIKMYSNIYGIDYIIFRSSHIYGNYQKKGLVPLLSDRVMKSDKVEIGNNVSRDFLNVNDFVDAIIKSIHYKKNEVFNLGTGHDITLKELIGMIAKILDKKVKIVENKNLVRKHKFERWNEVANTEKIINCGWKPKYNLKTWLKDNLKNG